MLGQGCPHCPKFLTAASRRSLGRVAVPVWLIILSDQLPIVALVGRHPTSQLIGRGPLLAPLIGFTDRTESARSAVLATLSGGCPPREGRSPTCYSAVRHCRPKTTVRLACFRHAASVYPEPGSNSPSNYLPTPLPRPSVGQLTRVLPLSSPLFDCQRAAPSGASAPSP